MRIQVHMNTRRTWQHIGEELLHISSLQPHVVDGVKRVLGYILEAQREVIIVSEGGLWDLGVKYVEK